ncbi:MAG: hypothetical protein GF344_13195 [Chitinivibrionales bacterium]|nr:hypothetical protein [Chitinivibrionales bacterium]MBD3357689.1 hypothetical protein [Chitinivibrionales bacterium]
MSAELRKKFREFGDEFIIDQFTRHREEYTEEALGVMADEIRDRGLDEKLTSSFSDSAETASQNEGVAYTANQFVTLDEPFSRTDLLIAHAVLREESIPFFVDAAGSSEALPLEAESSPHYTVHVHQDYLEKTRELIDAHFHSTGKGYVSKYTSARDRLKAFSFHEVRFTESELEEELDVSFTVEERNAIRGYVLRLINEADVVEERTGRMLFYYDNLEEVAERLEEGNTASLTRADLLTTLETLQVYCDEEGYPDSLDNVAEGLLAFVER